jgi:hypothetical protein
MTPTKPHPRGIVPTDPATDCTRTFSTGVKGYDSVLETALNHAKPSRALGMAILETHPVCRPKYVLEKQMTVPIASPRSSERRVKFCGC